MSDVTVTYKNEQIAELNASGGVTLKTAGKFCDGDIALTYEDPGAGSYLDNAFGPFVGRAPEASYPGNIVELASDSSISIADVLGHSFVGYTVVVIAVMQGVVADYCSISGDTQFSAVYESTSTKLKAWKGVLADNTTIANSASQSPLYIQMIAIANGYDVSLNSDLTGYVPGSSGSFRNEINTDYLKTLRAFMVGAKLPNNYGIMCLFSRYDFSDSANYNPAIWEPIDRFVKLPEICLRRLNGGRFETGLGVFLKVDPDSYIQYFSRGSVHGQINTSSSIAENLYNVNGVSSGYPALGAWNEVPQWANADLDVMFLDVTPIS